jgi:lipopolysaccharide export system protein LptC
MPRSGFVYSVQGQDYQAASDARFAVAARHSRRIRFLRKAVPAAVAAALLMIALTSIFNPFRILAKLPLEVDNLVVSGTRITMESPHLAGFTPDQRPYELWAKTATQDVTKPTHVELKELRAKVQMEDKSGLTMDATSGLFDTKSQVLNLTDHIFLQSSTGYEARLTQARVDMANGTVTSDQPVAVKLLNGTLDAQRLEITENGELVRFDGGVSMVLVLDEAAKSGAANSGSAAPASAAATHDADAR